MVESNSLHKLMEECTTASHLRLLDQSRRNKISENFKALDQELGITAPDECLHTIIGKKDTEEMRKIASSPSLDLLFDCVLALEYITFKYQVVCETQLNLIMM